MLVEDINDNAPEFVNDNLTLTVMEETWIYETVPVTATDRDSGLNAEIIYTLADQNDGKSSLFVLELQSDKNM